MTVPEFFLEMTGDETGRAISAKEVQRREEAGAIKGFDRIGRKRGLTPAQVADLPLDTLIADLQNMFPEVRRDKVEAMLVVYRKAKVKT